MMFWKTVLVGVLSLFVCAAVASAAGVDVSAVNAAGWTWATKQGGWPASVVNAEFVGANDSGAPSPNGLGSFHLQTGYNDNTNDMMRAYLGTNNHTGTSLSAVTSFNVSTQLRYRDNTTGSRVGYSGSGATPGLQPLVEVWTGSSATTPSQARLFVAYPKNASLVQVGTWQTWNLMDPTQVEWQFLNTSSTNNKGDWNWLVGRYPGLKFQNPKAWDPAGADWFAGNILDTSISVKLGAGGRSPATNNSMAGDWWKEASGVNGYVSNLTIGIGGAETSYNFVPEPATMALLALGALPLLRRRRR